MSWSVTVNDLQDVTELPEDVLAKLADDNVYYAYDAKLAFTAAKTGGLTSATLSGGRTPSPYGGPDSVVISVVGFAGPGEGHAVPRHDFYREVMNSINAGGSYHWQLEPDDDTVEYDGD